MVPTLTKLLLLCLYTIHSIIQLLPVGSQKCRAGQDCKRSPSTVFRNLFDTTDKLVAFLTVMEHLKKGVGKNSVSLIFLVVFPYCQAFAFCTFCK